MSELLYSPHECFARDLDERSFPPLVEKPPRVAPNLHSDECKQSRATIDALRMVLGREPLYEPRNKR